MPFKAVVAVYCENHMKSINILCGKNAELLSIKQAVCVVTSGR